MSQLFHENSMLPVLVVNLDMPVVFFVMRQHCQIPIIDNLKIMITGFDKECNKSQFHPTHKILQKNVAIFVKIRLFMKCYKRGLLFFDESLI